MTLSSTHTRGLVPARDVSGGEWELRPAAHASTALSARPISAEDHNPVPQRCWTAPEQRGYLAVTMSVLVSRLDPASATYRANRSANLRLLEELDEPFAQSRAGGGERCVPATGTRYRAASLPLRGGEGRRRLRRVPDMSTKAVVANCGKLTRQVRTTGRPMGRSARSNSSTAHGDGPDCGRLGFELFPSGDGRPSSKASHLVADNEGLLTCDGRWIDPGEWSFRERGVTELLGLGTLGLRRRPASSTAIIAGVGP